MADGPQTWPEIVAWRKARRAELIAARRALPPAEHHRASDAVLRHLAAHFTGFARRLVGFYWPYQREFSPVPFIEQLIAQGGTAALPVVVEPRQPLEFRPWHPGVTMAFGVYDIPYPAEGAAVTPEVLLVALLGFDEAGYRLGYGGGYYDRTLAALATKPLCIGVGFELGRLATIFPQPHDVPMDFIVSDAGAFRREGPHLLPAHGPTPLA
jgi:5-formyltetrahydrofolate cyclo-ligase